ncbi:MAG: histidine kinase [Bacteroidetes bacterium]|nr:histidine kinase [Bacteroidota bacterium]
MNNIHNIRYNNSFIFANKMKQTDSESNLKRIVYKYTLIFFVVMIALNTLNYTFQDLSSGYKVFFVRILIGEIVAFGLFYALVPAIYYVIINYPISQTHLVRNILIQFAATVVMTSILTNLIYEVRTIFWPILGFGKFEYGKFEYRIVMEYSRMLLMYGILYIGIYALKNLFDSQQQKVKAAQLEEQLAKSKIEVLQMQLNPHFLFNTLNVISSTMYEDVNAADKMIADLSDLLRITFNKSGDKEQPLHKEIEMLNLYVDIMRMRFKDKLNLEIDTDTAASQCLVPVFILQPLVENSIRHSTESVEEISIKIKTSREEDKLVLTVRDTGPGVDETFKHENGNGIGLSNTASRLESLYGSSHQLTMGNLVEGGFEVKIIIPYHEV